MKVRLRVYGGLTFSSRFPRHNGSRQARTLVAAPNKKRALELLDQAKMHTSGYEFNLCWTETYNKLELATATEQGVWIDQSHHDNQRNFERVL